MHTRQSRLLLDEPPLIIQPSIAVIFGLNAAFIIQQLHYWHRKGYEWAVNSHEEWRDQQFPFWSVDTVKRIFQDLEKIHVVEGERQKGFDRRKKYRLNYTRIAEIEAAHAATLDAISPGLQMLEPPDRQGQAPLNLLETKETTRTESKNGEEAKLTQGEIEPELNTEPRKRIKDEAAIAKAYSYKELDRLNEITQGVQIDRVGPEGHVMIHKPLREAVEKAEVILNARIAADPVFQTYQIIWKILRGTEKYRRLRLPYNDEKAREAARRMLECGFNPHTYTHWWIEYTADMSYPFTWAWFTNDRSIHRFQLSGGVGTAFPDDLRAEKVDPDNL